MKRFLLLFCSVVLVCSLMIVPALAAGNGIISFTDLEHPLADRVMIDEPVSGDYYIRFFSSASPDPIGVSPDFSIDPESGQCFEFELLDCVVFFCPASFMTDDGMVFTCCFQASASDEEVSLYDYLDITRFDLVPVGYDLKPDPEPVPELVSPFVGIGEFFSSVMLWLASLASVVVNSPVLTVFVVCFVIVGFVVALGKRLKS